MNTPPEHGTVQIDGVPRPALIFPLTLDGLRRKRLGQAIWFVPLIAFAVIYVIAVCGGALASGYRWIILFGIANLIGLTAVEILLATTSLRSTVPIVKGSHEWFGGQGYPDGIAGAAIPLACLGNWPYLKCMAQPVSTHQGTITAARPQGRVASMIVWSAATSGALATRRRARMADLATGKREASEALGAFISHTGSIPSSRGDPPDAYLLLHCQHSVWLYFLVAHDHQETIRLLQSARESDFGRALLRRLGCDTCNRMVVRQN